MHANDPNNNDHMLVRDYTLMRCDFEAEGEAPAISEYWAFHDGDDCEVPSCVFICTDTNGEFDTRGSECDYDERKAVEVHHIDALYLQEVKRLFFNWVETHVGANV